MRLLWTNIAAKLRIPKEIKEYSGRLKSVRSHGRKVKLRRSISVLNLTFLFFIKLLLRNLT